MSARYFLKILFPSLAFLSFAHGQTTTIDLPDQLPPCPAEFLTDSLLASDGSIWVTSEGKGVYRLDPSKEKQSGSDSWFDVSYYEGMPDTSNYYTLAEDKQGRIWVGTDNKGVAVFNGEKWKTYDRENALLGERIFDITVSPVTGDVAIATSGGVNIYQPQTQNWLNLTRAEGLVEDQVEALAYDNKGNLWLGYQCGGVSQLSEKDKYQIVKTDQAKWYWDKDNRVRQPVDGSGKGLPSNLCNAVYPTKSGTILLGTSSGLALKVLGKEWNYIRGADYRDKNKGLWDVKVDKAMEDRNNSWLLPEDCVSCITETAEGWWIGFRQKGAVLIKPGIAKIIEIGNIPQKIKNPYMTSLIALPGGSVYAGTYGHGLIKLHEGKGKEKLKMVERKDHASHPSVPPVKSLEEMQTEAKKLEQLVQGETPKAIGVAKAVFWKEDWATRGNWCERYGQQYALLCGTHGKFDDEMYCLPYDVKIDGRVGGHPASGGLMIRNGNDDDSENVNVLFNPCTGTRVSNFWIDKGENYENTADGPDIWVAIRVPEGINEIALYFYNYEGQDLNKGADRDYLVELRKYTSTLPSEITFDLKDLKEYPQYPADCREKETRRILQEPVLARTRVTQFAKNGVYQVFLVEGAGDYYIRVTKNYSRSTIMSGVFVTTLGRDGKPIEREAPISDYAKVYPRPSKITPAEKMDAGELINMWNQAAPRLSGIFLSQAHELKFDLYRFAKKKETNRNLLSNWQWQLKLWNKAEQLEFDKTMSKSWCSNQKRHPIFRSAEFFPYSPNVIPFTADECEVIEHMGLNWKEYLPDAEKPPAINAIELKEKIASMIDEDREQLQDQYFKKKKQEAEKNNS